MYIFFKISLVIKHLDTVFAYLAIEVYKCVYDVNPDYPSPLHACWKVVPIYISIELVIVQTYSKESLCL